MLDSEITELAGKMISVQFEERSKQLGYDIAKIQSNAQLAGAGGTSSALRELVYEQCGRDIDIRLQIVWQNLYRVLSHAGVEFTDTLANDLKREALKYADAIYDEPNNCYQRVAKSIPVGQAKSLMESRDHAYAKVNAEIDLFVLGLRRQEEARKNNSAAVFNFYSPVGAVQSGPNTTANVYQTIDAQDRQAIFEALQALRMALDDIQELPNYPKHEIVDLVSEVESETQKTSPNSSKVSSLLLHIATAIQTVGSLKPAYDTLKTALIPLGISLP